MKQFNQKPKIAILTLHPYNYGGVLSLIKVVHKFCQNYFEPKLFFLGFDSKISTSLKKLKFFSQIKNTNYFGFNSVEVGAKWAFWEPGHYKFTKSKWISVLKDYDYFFVASGTCIAAHPLTLLDKKFAVWLATTFDEDRAQRVSKLNFTRKIIDKFSCKKMRIIEKEILNKSNFIFALSNYTKKTVENVLQQKSEKIVTCNYPMMNPFDKTLRQASVCAPPQRGASPDRPGERKGVIAVGRFDDPRKNLDMLIKVFDKLNAKIPNLKLNIIGPSSDKLRMNKYCVNKTRNFNNLKNINFTGLISDQELKNYYNSASLMLITSYQEGLGIVGLEALSNGVPVVATNCGGTSDFVVNGKNGFLVDVNDVDGMVNKALQILESKKLQKNMSEFAVKFVERNFSELKIYSIFKYGLSKVYPELTQWFEKCDGGIFKAAEKVTIESQDKDDFFEKQRNAL